MRCSFCFRVLRVSIERESFDPSPGLLHSLVKLRRCAREAEPVAIEELFVGANYQFGRRTVRQPTPKFNLKSAVLQLYWLSSASAFRLKYLDLALRLERMCRLYADFCVPALSATNGGYGVYGVLEEDELLSALHTRLNLERFSWEEKKWKLNTSNIFRSLVTHTCTCADERHFACRVDSGNTPRYTSDTLYSEIARWKIYYSDISSICFGYTVDFKEFVTSYEMSKTYYEIRADILAFLKGVLCRADLMNLDPRFSIDIHGFVANGSYNATLRLSRVAGFNNLFTIELVTQGPVEKSVYYAVATELCLD